MYKPTMISGKPTSASPQPAAHKQILSPNQPPCCWPCWRWPVYRCACGAGSGWFGPATNGQSLLVAGKSFLCSLRDNSATVLIFCASYCDSWWVLKPDSNRCILLQSPVLPSSEDRSWQPKAAMSYWLTTSSGTRHNQSCRWDNKSKGRASAPDEGVACKICGG